MLLEALRTYLEVLPHGPVANPEPIIDLLRECWDKLPKESSAGGMDKWKLDRMEKPIWEYPRLTFGIERHGPFVLGSKSASIQQWTVDVVTGETAYHENRGRVMVPRTKPLDVGLMAKKVVDLILNGADDACLRWTTENSVRLLIGKVLPQGSLAKETIEGRRRRLRKAIEKLLVAANWSSPRPNVFVRKA